MSTPTISQIIDEHFKSMQERFQQYEAANARLVWFLSEALRRRNHDFLTVPLEAIPNITIEVTDNKDGTVTLTRKEQATPVAVQEPELVQS